MDVYGKAMAIIHKPHIYRDTYHIWPWVKTYGAIFGWMNIHLPSILMFTRVPRF